MYLKALTLAALSAGALSQSLALTDPAVISVLGVLQTAIPPESLAFAASNQTGFAAEVASSIAANNAPAWYAALPSDVKTILPQIYPAATAAPTTPAATPSYAAPSETGAGATISGAPSSGNSTVVGTVTSATLASTGGVNSDAPMFTGAASHPTAVIGAGVAGAIGFLGMLAL